MSNVPLPAGRGKLSHNCLEPAPEQHSVIVEDLREDAVRILGVIHEQGEQLKKYRGTIDEWMHHGTEYGHYGIWKFP